MGYRQTARSSSDIRAEELQGEGPDRSGRRESWTRAAGAFGLYLVASVVFFGLPILSDPRNAFIGPPTHPDSRFFFWALAWWPHALIHGLNPIWTNAAWAPIGYNMAWAPGAPGPSLLVLPVTVAAGPIASYNLLALLACPMAALTAFILCRYVTGRFLPSLVGGYLFGFSTYQLGHLGLHVYLELVFVMPLAVYLVLLRLDGAVGARRFVLLLTVLLALQFLTSTELFATMLLFGGLTAALAFLLGPSERRAALLETGKLIGMSLLLTGIVVSPYLWYAFAYGVPRRGLDGSDLLSFFVPRLRTLIGSGAFFPVTRKFPAASREDTAYLGLPLIGILVHFAVTERRRRSAKLLVGGLLVTALATLGPKLYVNGHGTIALPWRAVQSLPVVNNAAPRRFSMYVFLIAAVMVAMWLSAGGRPWARWGAALVAVAMLIPNYSPNYLHGRAEIPRFFASGDYRRFVEPGENVLVMPAEAPGRLPQASSVLIQARTGFWFRMPLGYTGPPPPEYRRSPILQALYEGRVPAVGPAEFGRFLGSHQVRAIILDRGSELEPGLTALMNAPPERVDDVLIYEVQST